MSKPVIKRFDGRWVCKTAYGEGHAFEQYNQLFLTQSDTPRGAWRLWILYTRRQAFTVIAEAVRLPPVREPIRSAVAIKALAMIEHDRYLTSVHGRECARGQTETSTRPLHQPPAIKR